MKAAEGDSGSQTKRLVGRDVFEISHVSVCASDFAQQMSRGASAPACRPGSRARWEKQGKEKRSPPSCPVARAERRSGAGRQPLALARLCPSPSHQGLRGRLLPRAEICGHCQQAGAMKVGKCHQTGCLKAQTGALMAPGPLIQHLPWRAHLCKEVCHLQQKKGKITPLFLGFKNASPP